MVYRTQNKDLGSIFVVETETNFSILGSCKWRPAFGCSFESQLPSGSYEYTHYCSLICLPGNIIANLDLLNNGKDLTLWYAYSECGTCSLYKSWRRLVKSKVTNLIFCLCFINIIISTLGFFLQLIFVKLRSWFHFVIILKEFDNKKKTWNNFPIMKWLCESFAGVQ